MATMVVLLDDASLADLTAERLGQLSRLGVTDVSVLRDGSTVGVVLDGWAFDPHRSATEAIALIGASGRTRALLPVMHAAVVPAP